MEELIKRRRAFAAELGITPKMQKNSNLNRAFAALEEEGVIARQNFTCCGTCASAEIWDEIDDSREWKGYIYFHQQDAEASLRAAEPTLASVPSSPTPGTKKNGIP